MKNILIVNGHPNPNSFCQALTNSYAMGAKSAGFTVEVMNLHELEYNCNYIGQKELETDLQQAQQKILNCQHLVLVAPMWWLGVPSLLKGFFDRVLTPGYAYKFTKFGVKRLLKGRSARVIYTMGGSSVMYSLLFLDSFWVGLKYGVLWLCGFSPVKRTAFSRVPYVSNEQRINYLKKVELLGQKGK